MNPGARRLPCFGWLLATGLALFGVGSGSAAPDTKDFAGMRLETLTAGNKVFEHVRVQGVTARTLTIVHSGGMASIPLRELSPELQAQFNYSPAAENDAEAKLIQAKKKAEARAAKDRLRRDGRQTEPKTAAFETLGQRFGSSPELNRSVDLRMRMIEFSLGVKDQGYRPSCSIFAVVSALEFQNAELCGRPEKLSEEYLIWATRKTAHRIPSARLAEGAATSEMDSAPVTDEGFALPEVVAALRAYGIPLQSAMPNTFGSKIEDIPDPSPEVMELARNRRRVYVHTLPGRDQATRIGNLIHALNQNIPVPIGLRWPHYRTLSSGFLSEQKPILDYAHAVTLVGYRCETGQLEDTVFLFKNSYGATWGEGGYGRVTFDYLRQYMLDAVMLEVQGAES